jgi:hypothetical protein
MGLQPRDDGAHIVIAPHCCLADGRVRQRRRSCLFRGRSPAATSSLISILTALTRTIPVQSPGSCTHRKARSNGARGIIPWRGRTRTPYPYDCRLTPFHSFTTSEELGRHRHRHIFRAPDRISAGQPCGISEATGPITMPAVKVLPRDGVVVVESGVDSPSQPQVLALVQVL